MRLPGKNSARRDFVLVLGVSLAAAILCVQFDVSESLTGWTRSHERLQLDELPGVLLVMALCLIWFSSRRYFEAKRQLALRTMAESRLAEALADNQRLAQKYVDMQEYERKALARDLHDELGQYINAIKLDAVALRDGLPNEAAMSMARAMIGNIDRVFEVVRDLISQLRPVGLDDLGLVAALEHCVGEWQSRLPRTVLTLSLGAGLEQLDETRGLVLFRLIQEALTNIARHSAATRVTLSVDMCDSPARADVTVSDNGRGADLTRPRNGLGLIGMRERVAAIGGTVRIASTPGLGFNVQASLPLPLPLPLPSQEDAP